MRSGPSGQRFLTAAFGLGCCLVIASCGGSDRVAVYPVRGRVLHDGKPAVNAFVRIFPVDRAEGAAVHMPRGRADRDGYFTLTTYEFGDGAPAGSYVATIVWRAPLPGASPHDEVLEYAAGGPDQLEGRYEDPAKSPLRVTIKPESNELVPFDVQ